MSVKDKISEDIKTAMKAQDKERLSVLRMVLSELKYAQAQENVHQDLSPDAALKVVAAYHKRLSKSLADYPEGEKRDVITSEMKIVEEYLPKKASEDDVQAAVKDILAQTADRQFGTLMKQVMTKLGGSADGQVVSRILKQSLGN